MSTTIQTVAGQDLTNRHVVLKESILLPQFRDLTWRVVLATGGFGCNPHALGRAVFVTYIRDGEKARYDRSDFERFATDAEVEAARVAGDPDYIPEVS